MIFFIKKITGKLEFGLVTIYKTNISYSYGNVKFYAAILEGWRLFRFMREFGQILKVFLALKNLDRIDERKTGILFINTE